MEKFFQSTLGMFTLFALGALAVYVIAAGFQSTWNPFMAAAPVTGGVIPVFDENGKATRRTFNVLGSYGAKQRACCSTGDGGFIGNCNFPIKPTDRIPSCA